MAGIVAPTMDWLFGGVGENIPSMHAVEPMDTHAAVADIVPISIYSRRLRRHPRRRF